jgi:hypothetical protein
MAERKKTYRKGLLLFNKETKEKIIFGKWNDDIAVCLVQKTKMFLNITRDDLDNKYQSYAELERKAREQRRGQCW